MAYRLKAGTYTLPNTLSKLYEFDYIDDCYFYSTDSLSEVVGSNNVGQLVLVTSDEGEIEYSNITGLYGYSNYIGVIDFRLREQIYQADDGSVNKFNTNITSAVLTLPKDVFIDESNVLYTSGLIDELLQGGVSFVMPAGDYAFFINDANNVELSGVRIPPPGLITVVNPDNIIYTEFSSVGFLKSALNSIYYMYAKADGKILCLAERFESSGIIYHNINTLVGGCSKFNLSEDYTLTKAQYQTVSKFLHEGVVNITSLRKIPLHKIEYNSNFHGRLFGNFTIRFNDDRDQISTCYAIGLTDTSIEFWYAVYNNETTQYDPAKLSYPLTDVDKYLYIIGDNLTLYADMYENWFNDNFPDYGAIDSGKYRLKNNYNINDTEIYFTFTIGEVTYNKIQVINNKVIYSNDSESIIAGTGGTPTLNSPTFMIDQPKFILPEAAEAFNEIFTTSSQSNLLDKNNCKSISFYSGIPFIEYGEDVLVFNSINSRDIYLSKYLLYELNSDDKLSLVFYEGQKNIYIPYKEDMVDLSSVSYIRVRLYNGRELFYYVNSSYTAISPNSKLSWNMDISMDYWQTYFIKGNFIDSTLDIPVLKEVNYVKGHNLDGDKLAILEGNNSNKGYTFSEIPSLNDLYSAAPVTRLFITLVTSKGDFKYLFLTLGVGVSDNQYKIATLPDLFDFINNTLSRVYKIKQASLGLDEQCTLGNVYVIPSTLAIYSTGKLYSLTYYTDSGEEADLTGLTELYMQKSVTSTYKQNVTFTQKSSIDKRILIGTKNINIELPQLNDTTFSVNVSLNVNGLNASVIIECGGQIIDVSSELQFPLAYNEERQYYLNHSEAIDSKMSAQQIANGVALYKSSINAASSIATAALHPITAFKTIPAALNSLGDMTTSIANIDAQQKANEDYLKFNTKANVNGNGNIIFNLLDNITLTPIKIYSMTFSNSIEINKLSNMYGYKTYGFYDKLDISTYSKDYRFLQCSCLCIGKFYKLAQTRLENMFNGGIRIWYNPDKFLQ